MPLDSPRIPSNADAEARGVAADRSPSDRCEKEYVATGHQLFHRTGTESLERDL
jgi:hypothetical protein